MQTSQPKNQAPAPVFVPILYAAAQKQTTEALCRMLTLYGFSVRTTERLRTEVYRDACRAGLIVVVGQLRDDPMEEQLLIAAKERKLVILHVSFDDFSADYPHIFAKLHPGFDTKPSASLIHRLFVTGLCTCPAAFSAEKCNPDPLGELIMLAVGAHKQDDENMYALAQAYLQAKLLPYSDKQAVHWLSLAAERQNKSALVTLGLCCLDGQGTQKDPARGYRLLENAATLGDKKGQY